MQEFCRKASREFCRKASRSQRTSGWKGIFQRETFPGALSRRLFRDPTVRRDTSRNMNDMSPHCLSRESHEVLRLKMSARWYTQLAALDVRDGLEPGRPARYEIGVTAENVSKLCEEGNLTGAVEALGVLVQAGYCVSKALFYVVLKECVGKRDLVLGRRVHAFTVEIGYQSDTFLCNHILRMYACHGRLQDAMDVFAAVGDPDAFTWSYIISAHVKHGQNKQAMQLYREMRRSSVMPDGYVFVAALQACGRGADVMSGRELHADVLAGGVEHDLFVCNGLVDMYAKCGNLDDAQRLFDILGEKDVVTWTSMIAGYSQVGMGQEALDLYSEMREEGMAVPSSVTFVCLLQACASVGIPALEEGKQLHAQIREWGQEGDVFVASSLVNMYAKCGSIEDAQGVFDGLGDKNVVTWSAMITGYFKHGMAEEALHLYSAMQGGGLAVPNSVTFVCLLQGCASLGTAALETGKQLHLEILEQGHQGDVLVANSLVNMYAKCGSLEDAQRVFDGLCQKDVVTWNAVIAGHSQQGKGQEALRLYSAMVEEGMVEPNSVTFVCLLQACATVGAEALERGRQLHAQIQERALQADVFVGNSLVNMYAKCGRLRDAQRVFDGLIRKDVVTWNAMIAQYSQQGMGEEALRLYSAMQEQDNRIVPDVVTFVCLLQACAGVGTPALEKGKQLHAQIREQGRQAEVLASSLVNMYAKCGSLQNAQRVFDGLVQKDVVTWNAMISGYSQQGMGQEALHLYSVMQEEGMAVPDSVTFVCLLQACAGVGTTALDKGKQLHQQISEQELEADVFLANSLVNMYAKCGGLEDAKKVFDGLRQKDVVTWNAMISAYSQQGMGHEALRLYSAMQEEGTALASSMTLVCLLQACAIVGSPALEKGKEIHAQIELLGPEADAFLTSSLVNMYVKCGSLQDAKSVFDGLRLKDAVTWSAMIAGYSKQGMGQEALHLYSAMQEEGIVVPSSVTFAFLLQACADVADVHVGRQLHAQIEELGCQTDVLVACSLISMYGESGSIFDAQQVFEQLPNRNVSAWNALIAVYSHQGDSEQVFDLVLKMRQDGIRPDGITFVSLLTVCSHAGLVSKGQEYFESMSRDYGIEPTVEHYTCMLDLLGRAGQLDDALDFTTTMPFLPDAGVWYTLLGACRKWSNVEVGRHAFDQAVKLDERHAAAYLLMSNIYSGAEMWEEAHGMQARRIRMRAWKQPGQSWWTGLDKLVHIFSAGEKKQPKSRARLKEILGKLKKEGSEPDLDSLPTDISDEKKE